MELHADIEIVRGIFDGFAEVPVGGRPRDHHAVFLKLLAVIVVELKPMAVPFGDLFLPAVRPLHDGADDLAGIGAEPHGAAQLDAVLIGHEIDDVVLALRLEFGRVGVRVPQHVARELDRRDLHAETDAEIRHVVFAGVLRRQNHPFDAAVSEPAGNDDPVCVPQLLGDVVAGQRFGVHPVDLHLGVVLVPPVGERLRDGEIGVVQLHVLAAKRDLHRLAARVDAGEHLHPFAHVDLLWIEMEDAADHRRKVALFQHERRFVEDGNGEIFDAALRFDVAEHRDFVLNIAGHGFVHARHDDVGRNAHPLQFLHRMLGGLGLEFVRPRDIGHQGDVDETAVLPPDFPRHLADGFDEGLAFDVARRPADLGDDHVGVGGLAHLVDEGLDLVGDVGNDLHRLAEILAAALLVEDVPVHLARGEVGILVEIFVDKPLVMPEVEVGFRPVFRHEHLSVLKGTHRARIDVYVGIEFLRRHLIAAHFQKPAQRSRRDALAQSRNDAARHKNVLGHDFIRTPVFFLLISSRVLIAYGSTSPENTSAASPVM